MNLFDHPDWLFELKYDGFRARAYVDGSGTKLISRRFFEYPASRTYARNCRPGPTPTTTSATVRFVKLGEHGRAGVVRPHAPLGTVPVHRIRRFGSEREAIRKLDLVGRKKLLRAIGPARSRTILLGVARRWSRACSSRLFVTGGNRRQAEASRPTTRLTQSLPRHTWRWKLLDPGLVVESPSQSLIS